MKKILVLFVLGAFVNLLVAQTSPATKPAATPTATTTTTTAKKEMPAAKAKMETPASTTKAKGEKAEKMHTEKAQKPEAKATTETHKMSDKGETKAKSGKKMSHDMNTKEHVCTAACKDGNHVYAHGEKGHVCTAACHPAKKATKAMNATPAAPAEKKG